MAGIVLTIVGIFVLLPIALFFAGRWLVFRIIGRGRAARREMRKITLAGFALYACLTLVLIVFCAAYQLQPDGPLGSFLHQPMGLLAAFLLTVVGFGVAETLLRKLGAPTMRDKDRRDV
jgi:ACR3 family arsenite efflux pump ArsB